MPTDPISPSVTEFWMEKIIAEKQAEAARAALQSLRERVEGLLDGMLRLRLTGAQMADLPEDGTNVEDFFVDFDEYEDWLPESVLRAAVLAEINRALEATNG
jgi:hypothetical protein